MKRAAPILPVLLAVLVLGLWLWLYRGSRPEAERNAPAEAGFVARGVHVTAVSPSATTPASAAPLLGETILRDYAKSSLPAENDLTLMARLMENFSLLVKSAANHPLSANEDWAAAFRGQNTARERFLPDEHAALDPQGRLVDRWGTPLFFHALGGRRFEIRSAGPDHKLWTADDIHRNADGSFRREAELNPPSLLGATPRLPAR